MKNENPLLMRIASWIVIVMLFAMTTGFASGATGQTVDEEEIAVKRFLDILERNPREGMPLERVYQYYCDHDRVDTLLDRYNREVSQNPTDPKKRLLWGLFLEKSGNHEDALNAYRGAAEIAPDDFRVRYYLGRLLAKQDLGTDAAESLTRAMEMTPPSVTEQIEAILLLGKVYAKIGDLHQFDLLLERVFTLFPDDETVLLNLVKTLESEKRNKEAVERYSRILDRLDPGDMAVLRCLLARAETEVKIGRHREAITDCEAILDHIHPENHLTENVFDCVEEVFRNQKDANLLVAFYQKRLHALSHSPTFMRRYADALYEAGRVDEAEKIMAHAVEKLPSDIDLRLQWIKMLAKQGNFDAVEQQFGIIATLFPDYKDYLETVMHFENQVRLYNKPGNEAVTVDFFVRSLLERADIAQQPELLDLMFGPENKAGRREVALLSETVQRLSQHPDGQAVARLLETRLAEAERSPIYLLEMAALDTSSVELKNAAYQVDPKRLFQDWEQVAHDYERLGAVDQLYDLLLQLDDAILLQHTEQLSRLVDIMTGKPDQRKAAVSFFDALWNKPISDENQRLQYRTDLLKEVIWHSARELAPYYREIVLELIAPANGEDFEENLDVLHNPHGIIAWSSEQCRSFSSALLAILSKNETEFLAKDIDRILTQYENINASQRDWPRYCNAVVMKALTDLKLDNPEAAFISLRNLEKHEQAIVPLISCGATLGQEFAKRPEEKYKRYAVNCFQKYRQINRHSYGEVYLVLQLSQLEASLAR